MDLPLLFYNIDLNFLLWPFLFSLHNAANILRCSTSSSSKLKVETAILIHKLV